MESFVRLFLPLLFVIGHLGGLGDGKSLVLIGGALSDGNVRIWSKIIELAGGRDVARIGIVTAASADPIDSAIYYRDMLLTYGALETYFIPVHEANKTANSDPEVVDNILRMSGFIFGGGDQARIITSFYNDGRVESPALAAIRSVYDNGGSISGISAGLSCQPWAVMIMDGISYDALLNGAFPAGEQTGAGDLIYDPLGGIGMLNDYALDSHFSERGREGRFIRLIADTRSKAFGVQYGIGADEDTAIVVYDVNTTQATGEVIGVAGALFVDLSNAVVDEAAPYFRIDGIIAHYLTQGDRINLVTRVVDFDTSWKANLAGNEQNQYAIQSNDIFGGVLGTNYKSEFTLVSSSVFDASVDVVTSGTTREKKPEFILTFTEGAGSSGYAGISPVTDRREISYTNLVIAIEGV